MFTKQSFYYRHYCFILVTLIVQQFGIITSFHLFSVLTMSPHTYRNVWISCRNDTICFQTFPYGYMILFTVTDIVTYYYNRQWPNFRCSLYDWLKIYVMVSFRSSPYLVENACIVSISFVFLTLSYSYILERIV